MILTVKTKDTILTSKGTTSIPAAIRQAAGLFPGSRIAWEFEGGEIRARRREGVDTKAQPHARKYAGTRQGIVQALNYSGERGHDPVQPRGSRSWSCRISSSAPRPWFIVGRILPMTAAGPRFGRNWIVSGLNGADPKHTLPAGRL